MSSREKEGLTDNMHQRCTFVGIKIRTPCMVWKVDKSDKFPSWIILLSLQRTFYIPNFTIGYMALLDIGCPQLGMLGGQKIK